jgi:hypothetical protein
MKASGGRIAASEATVRGEPIDIRPVFVTDAEKPPSGNRASDSASMLTRPFAACGRSGKPLAARANAALCGIESGQRLAGWDR